MFWRCEHHTTVVKSQSRHSQYRLIATQRVETIAGIFLDLVDLSEIMFMDDPAYIGFCCRPAVATGNERLDIHSSKQGGYEFADSGVGWDGLV
ncbi:uncharacterized protein BO88DRAFT_430216 [Aspergillus vadensis CBS 113365]|uniref:Uncharacterized protein n=1 Tax=Aspergillus vadensis (strain CBS 113365 / IMI 142717 / IBT 24658) TaxID=1448311 RepID=A0A319BK84_ASPVC|nr:hypothetical protein BO88DRAFT_430216 [Aspergillus vadensis CBS 113365]PYH63698.1 hypothetical protein BO88DRAFT_430216 [Aspergillus vadensis CBS 113365]